MFNRLKQFLKSDWFIALVFLGLFFLTHGYRYGWDDQSHEIPILKSFIDPTLYANDYFVQSLKSSFASFFYPLLGRIVTVDQVEPAYFILFCLSRYFMFFWMYKIWLFISKKKSYAFLCTLSILVLARVQPFLYLTFSHAEFSYMFVFAALYFFYKEQFVLSAAILGFNANIHAIYSLYPMMYMFFYLIVAVRKHRLAALFKSSAAFILSASPLLIMKIFSSLHSVPADVSQVPVDWLPLFKQEVPQLFFFGVEFRHLSLEAIYTNPITLMNAFTPYLSIAIFYILNLLFNKDFREEMKNHVIFIVSLICFAGCYFASYIVPNKFILILDFLRNFHFLSFFLTGYTMLLGLQLAAKEKPWAGFILGFLFCALSNKGLFGIPMKLLLLLFVGLIYFQHKGKSRLRNVFIIIDALLILGLCAVFVKILMVFKINLLAEPVFIIAMSFLAVIFLILQFPIGKKHEVVLKQMFVLVPVIILTVNYTAVHYKKSVSPPNTFDLIQEDWEDMQRHAKKLTPKDAVILVPYDMVMGGFRTLSERSIVCSQRDVDGLITFDLNATKEWKERLNDIKEFKLIAKDPVQPAILKAIVKYKADYIVFPTFNTPQSSNILYTNRSFALYKVKSEG